MQQIWKSQQYVEHAAFVPELGAPLVDLLDPTPGEIVLDLGCGDGSLTQKIAASGARVVGIDSSPDMVEAARQRELEVVLGDGMTLPFNGAFDAVFSNAALHWMRDPDAVIKGVAQVLKPSGRFVAEFGGHGNVAAIVVALRAALVRRQIDATRLIPWYFPTLEEYRDKLEQNGFAVKHIWLIPRPTKLLTDMKGWLRTFTNGLLKRLPDESQETVIDEIVELLRPVLCDSKGQWTADYVRLRFVAQLSAN